MLKNSKRAKAILKIALAVFNYYRFKKSIVQIISCAELIIKFKQINARFFVEFPIHSALYNRYNHFASGAHHRFIQMAAVYGAFFHPQRSYADEYRA